MCVSKPVSQWEMRQLKHYSAVGHLHVKADIEVLGNLLPQSSSGLNGLWLIVLRSLWSSALGPAIAPGPLRSSWRVYCGNHVARRKDKRQPIG